jgi:deazaflavin-dependent oxidoreductase (nitroreductase family)
MAASNDGPNPAPPRYIRPSRGDRWTAAVLRTLVHLGIGPWGARELRVRGRRSGQVRSTVVNVLVVDGRRYLVAPRGTTEWVRNLRASGTGDLGLGRRSEGFHAVELADDQKGPILKAYLDRWAFEVGRFFEGLDKGSSEEELARFAGSFPVFEIT